MKRLKYLSLLAAVTLTTTLFAACGTKNNQSAGGNNTSDTAKEVKITFLNSKGEIQAPLEEAIKAFQDANPNITVELITAAAGQSPFEKVSSMYASGNAPTLAMLDPTDIPKFSDKFLDLSDKKWVADATDGSLDSVKTSAGKVMAFPLTVEGAGFIYNKNVLDKAGVDPTTIKTTKDLEEAFKKVKTSGVDALAISPMDWSIAGHFLPVAYATQAKDSAGINQFLENLKSGKVDLTQNKQFNGLMDTLDVMKKYNIDSKDPLAGTYENDQQYMGTDKIGFWFMGNWTWPQIAEFAGDNTNFGFMPVPISNNAEDYGNTQIPLGVTKYIGIDKTNNKADQQAAAEKFLEWLVYDQTGQDYLVNKASVIPAFKNITITPADPLAKSIKDYMSKGTTIQFMTTMPSDHWSVVGAPMQKYLANKIDRTELSKEILTYWKNVK